MCIMSMYNSNSGAPSNQIVTTNTILIELYSLANFQGQYGYNRENTHAHVLSYLTYIFEVKISNISSKSKILEIYNFFVATP